MFAFSSQDQLKSRHILKEHMINGGPSCFGDSGGPLFTVTSDGTAVLVGVFSFMLWGTCRGRAEPSYFGRVANHTQWLMKYVPPNQVCTRGQNDPHNDSTPR